MTAHPAYRLEGPALISFSGGRTSAYMLHEILRAHDGRLPDDVVVAFANTGKEREETLRFVHECGSRWGVHVHWLERRDGKPGFEIVGFNSASRCGEPFKALIRKKGFLPNAVTRFCTNELKVRVMRDFCQRELGWKRWHNVIGLRYDEGHRVLKALARNETGKDPWRVLMPMSKAKATKRGHVWPFWLDENTDPIDLTHPLPQGFDLGLRDYEGNCDLCLAGETEVVTSRGIVPIRELVGAEPELLVPVDIGNGKLSEAGHFQKAPVRSFGVQRLWRIDLRGHGAVRKTIFATAEHRWFLTRDKIGQPIPSDAVPTTALKHGDKLRSLFRASNGERAGVCRMGATRGFIFGDGSTRAGPRAGTVHVHAGKDEVFLPLLDPHFGPAKEGKSATGKQLWTFYGLPEYWKRDFPSLTEPRRYLMGWLAGWFAADGCVSKDGNCILASAKREHLQFARSLCAVLGVQCASIREQVRDAPLPTGRVAEQHSIFMLNLNRHHLPDGFFFIKQHAERVAAVQGKKVRRYGWTVDRVEQTERMEEVFCATVEGVGAFGLADGLMTGNCFLKARAKLMTIMRDLPELAQWWIEQERGVQPRKPGGARFATEYRYEDLEQIVRDQGHLFEGWVDDGEEHDAECGLLCGVDA